MDNSLLNCILNPIRMRIVQSLLKNRTMTVQQISKDLPDVPQATLYRHLNKLLNSRAITVVKENKVRGVLEKVYEIENNPYVTVPKDLDKVDKSEYLNLFYNYVMTLLRDFETYIQSESVDLKKDGVTFRSAAMYLSDDEYSDFLEELTGIFNKIRDYGPSSERKLRKISTIITPSIDHKE